MLLLLETPGLCYTSSLLRLMGSMSQFQTGKVEKLGSFIDEGQVRGRDKTRAQALCFSSGLGANFSWSFFHTLLSSSWNSSMVSEQGETER